MMPETPPGILGTGAAAAVSVSPTPENPGEISVQGVGLFVSTGMDSTAQHSTYKIYE